MINVGVLTDCSKSACDSTSFDLTLMNDAYSATNQIINLNDDEEVEIVLGEELVVDTYINDLKDSISLVCGNDHCGDKEAILTDEATGI